MGLSRLLEQAKNSCRRRLQTSAFIGFSFRAYDRQPFVVKVVNNLALGYGPILAAFERSFFPHLLSQDSR